MASINGIYGASSTATWKHLVSTRDKVTCTISPKGVSYLLSSWRQVLHFQALPHVSQQCGDRAAPAARQGWQTTLPPKPSRGRAPEARVCASLSPSQTRVLGTPHQEYPPILYLNSTPTERQCLASPHACGLKFQILPHLHLTIQDGVCTGLPRP